MIAVHRGMGVTEKHWKTNFEIFDETYGELGVSEELREETSTFLRSFEPHVVGSPTFRDVVRDADDQRIPGGLKSFGVKWP
jgi:hemoglobin